MTRSTTMAAAALLALAAACAAPPQQQAEATQPASQPAPETQAPAAEPPAPPPPTPQPEPAQPPARQQASRPRPTRPAEAAPAPVPQEPAAPRRPAMASVPGGTVLSLAMDQEVTSKTAMVGDTFTATVLQAVEVDGAVAIPEGSKVQGSVTEAVAAKRGAGQARLALSFDLLRLPSGHESNIAGTFQEVTESKKKRNAAIIGGSAAGGALLGRILGKDTKGAVVGSIIGGGVGTAVVMGQEGEQVTLAADAPFEIRLEEEIRVPRQ